MSFTRRKLRINFARNGARQAQTGSLIEKRVAALEEPSLLFKHCFFFYFHGIKTKDRHISSNLKDNLKTAHKFFGTKYWAVSAASKTNRLDVFQKLDQS